METMDGRGQTPLLGLQRDGRATSAPAVAHPPPSDVWEVDWAGAAAAAPHPETKQERFLENHSYRAGSWSRYWRFISDG